MVKSQEDEIIFYLLCSLHPPYFIRNEESSSDLDYEKCMNSVHQHFIMLVQ